VVGIQKDLIRLDYCDSISIVKDSIIYNRNSKISLKDSIINSKNIQISFHKDIENAYKEQIVLKDEKIVGLETKIKKQRRIIWGLAIIEVINTVKNLISLF
jgi:hypothetical protein